MSARKWEVMGGGALLMSNEVLCCDCTEGMRSIAGDSVDLILADPPYGGLLKDQWDRISDYGSYSEQWLREARRILKPTGSLYCYCSIGPKSSSLLDIALILRRDWLFQDMIVWKKQRGRGSRRGWLFTREEILWATKTKDYKWFKQDSTEEFDVAWQKRLGRKYKRATNCWVDIEEPTIQRARESGCRGDRKPLHPCEKSQQASERIILAHTDPLDLVVSLFTGVGTDLLAAQKLGRRWLGFENNPQYCEVARHRITEISG